MCDEWQHTLKHGQSTKSGVSTKDRLTSVQLEDREEDCYRSGSKSTRSSAMAEGMCDALISIEKKLGLAADA